MTSGRPSTSARAPCRATAPAAQKRRVAAIAIHPRWNPDTFSNDAAVVTLAAPINGIRPISLVTAGTDALERPGTLLTVTGWATRSPSRPDSVAA